MGARELVLAAQRSDPAGFGQAYQEVLERADADAITESLLLTLAAVARDWFDAEAGTDGRGVLLEVHRRVSEVYPQTLELIGVNLVLLEHVVRSMLGHSDFVSTLDGSLATLYAALLLGNLLATADQFDRYAPAGPLAAEGSDG